MPSAKNKNRKKKKKQSKKMNVKRPKNALRHNIQIAVTIVFIGILIYTVNAQVDIAAIRASILLTHPNTYNLQQLLHYGLTANIFDPDSEYEKNDDFNPMFGLRQVCQYMLSDPNSSTTIKQKIIETAYPSTPSFIQNNLFLPLLTDPQRSANNTEIKELIDAMNDLDYFLELNCIPDQMKGTYNTGDNFVVIGAATSGLVSILSAFHSGIPTSNIVVIEKRASYLRDIWFDLYDEPFYVGKKVLDDRFGFSTQAKELFINWVEDMEVYIMRAQNLERFLAKIVYMIGIDIRYQHKLENVYFDDATNEYILQIADTQMDKKYDLRFAHLIGSDGSRSRVRELFNVSYTPQNEIVHNGYLYPIRDLFEVSLVVRFKATNDCPALEFDGDEELDPWSVSFEEDTIDAVFKRFYFHHCHFEILLNHKSKLLAVEEQKDVAYINSLVLNVSRYYLEDHVESLEKLKSDYVISNERNGEMFRIVKGEICLIDSSIKKLDGSGQIVFFVGDAAMTAHYRLGIGINTILDGYPLYMELFQKIQQSEYDLTEITQNFDNRLMEKVLFQTTTIWLEGLCHLLVFFGFDKPLDLNNMILYYRNVEEKGYDRLSEEELAVILEKCIDETVVYEEEEEGEQTESDVGVEQDEEKGEQE